MSKVLDVLFDKMDENVTGDENSRLYRTRDDWDDVNDYGDSAYISEESAGIFGEVFKVKDLVSHISFENTKKSLYSYRFRTCNRYPPFKEMALSQLEDLFDEWIDHYRYNWCSPFGCGSDQEWWYEFFDLDGERYMFTYGVMGS